MDCRNIENDSSSTSNVTSLEELYTDFDHWVISFKRFHSKRSIAEARQKKSQINTECLKSNLKWQLLIVHGFELEEKLQENSAKKIFSINRDSLNYDHVIFELIRNGNNIFYHYTKSKLYICFTVSSSSLADPEGARKIKPLLGVGPQARVYQWWTDLGKP